MRANKFLAVFFMLVLGLGAVGCSSHTGTGALLGGAGGALAGAAIGSHSHGRAGPGALVGGAIGAIGGAIVGNELDRQERDRYRYGDRYYDYDRGYRGGYGRARYGYDYCERRPYRPHYRRRVRYYDDCPPGGYRYRSYRSHGRGGRYYETAYYEYH